MCEIRDHSVFRYYEIGVNMRCVDLTGKRFKRLTVIKRVYREDSNLVYWLCKCDCGNKKEVRADSLKNGSTQSCGCYAKELATKHGLSHHPLYSIYNSMKERTTNKNIADYKYYGDRGIKVCKEWENDFMKFYNWAIDNGYKNGLSIDRIDVNGDYEPSNCRWSTAKEQCNNRGSNINITIGNATKSLMCWCEIFNVDYKKVYARYKRNGYEGIDRLFNDIL